MFRSSFRAGVLALCVLALSICVSQSNSSNDNVALASQTLAPDSKGEIVFDVKLPAGYHLNKLAPQKWQARVEDAGLSLAKNEIKSGGFKLPLRVKYSASEEGSGALVISNTIFYCTDDMGICKVVQVKLRAPFQIKGGGASSFKINAQISDDDKLTLVKD